MDVDDVAQLLERGIAAHQGRDFLNKVSSMCTEDVATDDSVVGIGQQLHQTFRGIHGECLAVGSV